MFIGRTQELQQLNSVYRTGKFQFLVMYGRHGVGKSAFLSEFSAQKPYLYFTAIESNESHNLALFLKYIQTASGNSGLASDFDSFESALESIFQYSTKQQMILILDNYPFLARACKSFSSILKELILKYKTTSKLFLILCGSGFSYMETLIDNEKSPLYQMQTGRLRLDPFDYFESCHFFKRFSTNLNINKFKLNENSTYVKLKIAQQLLFSPESPDKLLEETDIQFAEVEFTKSNYFILHFQQETIMKESKNQYNTTAASLPLYPVALMGSTLQNEKTSTIDEITNHILKFTGDKSFTIIESSASSKEEIEVIKVNSEMIDLLNGFAYEEDNTMTYVSSGIVSSLYSNDLTKQEMLAVLSSMQAANVK